MASPLRSAPRRLLRLVCGLAAGLAALVLLAELAASFTLAGNAAYFVEDPDLYLVRKPGLDGYTWGDGRWIACHINALGLRGDELPATRDPQELRVLCVGDSFTFGGGVETQDAWPAQLQALVGPPEASGVRVLNGGANGWDTPWQRLYLEKRGLREVRPDVVVLGWNWNDLHTVPDAPQRAVQVFLHGGGTWLSIFEDWPALQGTHLYRWFYSQSPGRTSVPTDAQLREGYATYKRTMEAVAVEPERKLEPARRQRYGNAPPDRDWWVSTDWAPWKTVRAEMARIDELCRQSGATFVVALLTEPSWEGPGTFPGVERMAALLDSLGVAWIDLQPEYLRRAADGTPLGRRDELWLRYDYAHPNAEGHAIFARAVRELLERRGLLRPRGGG
ncbi:MAG TPA: GDSL-type esterase/lipase family protein [Planctomycetota bacterium]|nr:GDSL-type esterase/lipase family protein [Planctomycetota bacterium]